MSLKFVILYSCLHYYMRTKDAIQNMADTQLGIFNWANWEMGYDDMLQSPGENFFLKQKLDMRQLHSFIWAVSFHYFENSAEVTHVDSVEMK